MKKYLTILATVLSLSGCASNNSISTAPEPEQTPTIPSELMSFDQMHQQVNGLNQYASAYPPRFENDAERTQVKQQWQELLIHAKAYEQQNSNDERALYLLGELYRLGHNMDIQGSAQQAIKYIDGCLSLFEDSLPCNFTAFYFYLSVHPFQLDKAKKSLDALSWQYHPNLHPEVEAGYVFYYLYKENIPLAKNQIDMFIENFPDSQRAESLARLKQSIESKQYEVKTN